MTIPEAKARIFDRLCSQYHKDGEKNVYVEKDTVRKDKDIPEEVFDEALNEFVSDRHRIVQVEIPTGRLRLETRGLDYCQDKKNPYR
jgi:hypothetical protein